jgi:hypothetical protein
VFPHVHFKQFMMKDASPETLVVATDFGWMWSGSFVDIMKHFMKHTNSLMENPSLALLDNHKSIFLLLPLILQKNMELQCWNSLHTVRININLWRLPCTFHLRPSMRHPFVLGWINILEFLYQFAISWNVSIALQWQHPVFWQVYKT